MSTAKISVVVSNLYEISENFGQPKTSWPKIPIPKLCTRTRFWYQNLHQNRSSLSNLKGLKLDILVRNHVLRVAGEKDRALHVQ